eukprot:Amastigsp_a2530_43.p1 type:complete len:167 gc:universal Amastigsp_a2530_43:544-44(-)
MRRFLLRRKTSCVARESAKDVATLRRSQLRDVKHTNIRQSNLTWNLDDMARKDELIDNEVDAFQIEENVELADVAEVLIERLDGRLNKFKDLELVGDLLGTHNEEQRRIAPVDDLDVLIFDERALLLTARYALAHNLSVEHISLLNCLVVVDKVLREARLPLLVRN